jgi:hypothetical protein
MIMPVQNFSTDGDLSNHSIVLPLETLRGIIDPSRLDANETEVVIGHLKLAFSPADLATTTDDKMTELTSEKSDSVTDKGVTISPDELCNDFCAGIESCMQSKQGSYCKIANSPSTCFALYWKQDPEGGKIMCYASDSDCPETDPVLCDSNPAI